MKVEIIISFYAYVSVIVQLSQHRTRNMAIMI